MKVVGTGLTCLDIINESENNIVMNGGTCANVVTFLAQLGETTQILLPQYIEDNMSDIFYSTFKKLGVELVFYANTKKNIPRIIEEYDDFKHVFYTRCPKCNNDLINNKYILKKEADCWIESLKENDMFFTDRISEGIKYIAKEFIQNGAKVFYEPNSSRNIKALIGMAKLSNVVKFSTERINIGLAETIIAECKNDSLELIIATHGKEGLSFRYKRKDGAFSDWIKGPFLEFYRIKDTSGAGDWLTAGFIHYWNRENYALNESVVYNALEKALKLSEIGSMTKGAQGLFYDKVVFNILKNEYNIKLKAVLDKNISCKKQRFCEICLSKNWDK